MPAEGRPPLPDQDVHERAHEARLLQAGRLMGGIVHEVKNPLAVIQGYAQLLQERATEPADREDLSRLLDEARRLGTLVEDMLDFVRRGADAAETVDLHRVVEAALNLARYELRQARVSVVANLGDDAVLVRGQHGVYLQVLLNLIANARHAMQEAQTSSPGLSLRLQDGASGRVQVVVANNGPAIDAEMAEHVFTPFVTTRRDGGGTGLGLALCREILQRFDGDISLDPPRAGQSGASFRLDLPRV